MIILGIDPGTTRIGTGIIKVTGTHYQYISCGLLVDEKILKPLSLEKKLVCIYEAITQLIKKIQPSAIGIETLVFAKNVKTAFPVAYARAIILLACSQNNLPLFEPTPMQVKQGVSSKGNASKQQVAFMVKTILNIPQETKILDDITDALAVAITTANFKNVWHSSLYK